MPGAATAPPRAQALCHGALPLQVGVPELSSIPAFLCHLTQALYLSCARSKKRRSMKSFPPNYNRSQTMACLSWFCEMIEMSAKGMGNSPSMFYSNLLNGDTLRVWPEEDASHILSRMVPTKRVDPCVDYLGRRTKGQACSQRHFSVQ